MTTYILKVIPNKDGSHTITCGAWILCRRFADGSVKWISNDAPIELELAASDLIATLPVPKH